MAHWLLAGNDVAAIIALAERPPAIVIAPDRHERGTNALLLAPPDAIDVAFGPGSARRHAALARAAGIEPAWYRSKSIGLDVDDAEDLALYAGAGGEDRHQGKSQGDPHPQPVHSRGPHRYPTP